MTDDVGMGESLTAGAVPVQGPPPADRELLDRLVAAERRAARLTALQALTAELAAAMTEREVGDVITRLLCERLGSLRGSLCLRTAAGDALAMVATWGVEIGPRTEFATFPLDAELPASEAVRERRVVVVANVAERDRCYPQLVSVGPAVDHALIAAPLVVGDDAIGCITGTFVLGTFSPDDSDYLRTLADQCAGSLHRIRLIAADRAAAERLRVLSEASTVLGDSLDARATLANLLHLLVNTVADTAVLRTYGEHAPVIWIALHANPQQQHLLDELMTVRSRLGSHTEATVAEQAEQREVRVFEYVGPGEAGVGEEDATRASLVRSLDIRSAAVVPIANREAVLGALTLTCSASSGKQLTTADEPMLRELGMKVANAIRNAHELEQARTVALALQHSLLPSGVPDRDDLVAAALYRAGTVGTEVGGDWWDVIPLSGARAAIVVGDVMGRGVSAAAAMGQLRATIRAYAPLDLPPSELLARVDAWVAASQSDHEGAGIQFATVVYAVWDPAVGELEIASAGHLPPLISDADGARFVDVPGVVLGVGRLLWTEGSPFQSVRLPLRPDTRLVLYTDGLVESPSVPLGEGLERLRSIVDGCTADPNAAAEHIVTHVLGPEGGADDDVALLIVQACGEVRRATFSVSGQHAVGEVRHRVRETLREWEIPELTSSAELVASELITNGLRYSGGDVLVRLCVANHRFCLEVEDTDPRLPRLRRPAITDEGGRGLMLVDAVASRWGARDSGVGKVVWAELVLPEPG